MSTCVEKIGCPDCGSSDSLQTYLNVDKALGMEWYSSFCHGACNEQKGDPYNGTKAPKVYVKTEEDIAQEVEDVRRCTLFRPRNSYRGIPGDYYYSWGCRTLLSEFDGKTPYGIGFPMSNHGKLTGWKCRTFRGKSFFGYGNTRSTDPFGFERAKKICTDTLWITEGEFDAIALDYCMTLVGNKKHYPTISLTHGGGSAEKNLFQIMDRLHTMKIKNLVWVLDDDSVGIKAEESIKELWDRNYFVTMPKGCKDPNDAVKLGYEEEMGELALNYDK